MQFYTKKYIKCKICNGTQIVKPKPSIKRKTENGTKITIYGTQCGFCVDGYTAVYIKDKNKEV